jgi:hypothetical protein
MGRSQGFKEALSRFVSLDNHDAKRPEVWNTPFFQASKIPEVLRLRTLKENCVSVFVSHRRADVKDVNLLWDFLRVLRMRHQGRKLLLWSDGWGIPSDPETQWAVVREIPLILSHADVLVFVLTADYFTSPWCILELHSALCQRNLCHLYTFPGGELELLAGRMRAWQSLPSTSHLARHQQEYLKSMLHKASQEPGRIWQMKLLLLIGLTSFSMRWGSPIDLGGFLVAEEVAELGGTLPADLWEAQATLINALKKSGWKPAPPRRSASVHSSLFSCFSGP